MVSLSPSSLVCEFFVEGEPVAQGSMVPRVTKDGRPYMKPSNEDALRKWRRAVVEAARTNLWGEPVEGAVVLVADFAVLRPKTVKRDFPSTRPDLDKLVRALCDGITEAGVWKDDGQVVRLHVAEDYAERAGVTVRIHQLEGNQS